MRKWFYSLYHTHLHYQIDKEAMVARVDVNKPDEFIFTDDRAALDGLVAFFNAAGYYVIVRYK